MFCVIIIRSWSFFASYQLSDKLLDEENFLGINFPKSIKIQEIWKN